MMDINRRCLSLSLILLIPFNLIYGNTYQDDNGIHVGQRVPNIDFMNIQNSNSRQFSTNELVKPTILYFFSAVCRASFSHFSKVTELHTLHKQNFDLLMIGIDLDDKIQDIYQRYSQKYNLQLPVTFDKSVFKQYHINGVPHVIWINRQGIVQAITNVLDERSLENFIKGEDFDFISYDPKDRAKQRIFNPEEPFLINGNGGEARSFFQRSMISEWKIGMPNNMPFAEPNKSPLKGLKYLQALGRELADLYRIAYFGKTYAWHTEDSVFYGNYRYSPILEIRDKSKFDSDYDLGKNLFCYSQILPPDRRTPTQMMKVMQRDLENIFGYDVFVETRQMPYLSLVVSDKLKLSLNNQVKTGEPKYSLTQISVVDKPISSLVSALSYYLDLTVNDLPLINETEINGVIDISFEAIMTDLDDVKKALRKQGLDIVKKDKPMKVIVIRDP